MPDYRHHVFISYSRKDTDIMRRVRDDLRSAGLTVWTDETLTPGTPSWQDAIETAIENAGCVVVILSPDAKQSEWLKKEINYAIIQGTRIFPILASGEPRSAIPFVLISFHFADIREDYDAAISPFIAAINELVGIMPTVQQLTTYAPKPTTTHTHTQDDLIKVLIVDDIDMARESIKKMLAFEEDFKVVGTAATGREAIEMVKQLRPNIVLMDINMPDMDGIAATAKIMNAFPQVAVIMVSVQNHPDYLRQSMLAGARQFLTKPVDFDELYETIRVVHRTNKLRF